MSSKGFGAKGRGVRYGLKFRLASWEQLTGNKAGTRVDMMSATSAVLHRPGCKAVRYHKPGSNKK